MIAPVPDGETMPIVGTDEIMDDSLGLALEALRDRLLRDADRETRDAMLLECYALAGYTPREIDERLGIDRETRKAIIARLRRALRRLDD